MDRFIYETSKISDDNEPVYKSKQFVYINDINQSNYASNQIQYDLTSLMNSSKLINFKNMYLMIPLVTVMSTPTIQTNLNTYGLTFKSGYNNLINSVYLESDGQTIAQASVNTNMYVNYVNNTTYSQNDINTKGLLFGYYPDTPTSWSFNDTKNNKGMGSSNNVIYKNSNDIESVYEFNEGAYYRAQKTAGFTSSNSTPVNGSQFLTQNNQQDLQDYVKLSNGSTGSNITYVNTAIIKLSDILNFFDSLPLCRLYCRMTLNLNIGSFVLNTYSSGSTACVTMNLKSLSFPFNTNPIMISALNIDANARGGLNLTKTNDNNAQEVTISVQIARNLQNGNTNQHTLNSTRIYAEIIELQPELEKSYIMNNMDRQISWLDIYSTQLLNIGVGSQYNYVVSNGISHIEGVLCIPFISEVANVCGDISCAPSLSPFSSEPSTTSPLLQLSQLNIYLAGNQLLNQNIYYSYENFFQQILCNQGINGSASKGLSSGSIGLIEHQNNYRYYYFDCSRHSPDDIAPKSVSISGSNLNQIGISIYIFVIYKKYAQMNIETGKLKVR